MNRALPTAIWAACLVAGLLIAPEALAAGLEGDREFQDDIGPGPLLLLLVALFVIFAMVGVGMVLAVAAFAVAALLAAFGIVSASAAFGFLRGSAASGFRAFFLLGAGVAGLGAGAGLAWLCCWMWEVPWHDAAVIAAGGGLGMISGIAAAMLFNFTWGRAIDWWQARKNQPMSPDRRDTPGVG